MENPTIVVLTDRNDLDDQLFGTFARCRDLLRQAPVQAADRADLRAKLDGRLRRRRVHDDPEVLPRGEGRSPSGPVGPPQHRRHRRRGAPQPVRLHRRLRPAHARRPAQRLVHRLHRHADRADRRQHAGGVRRLHQRLRHPAGGDRWRHRPDLLREPARQAGVEGIRAAQDRPRVRGSDRGRGSRAQGEAQVPVGATRSGGRLREPDQADRPRPGRPLREPARHDGRQGDGRVHEPPDLRRPVPGDRGAAAGLGSRRRRTRRAQDRDDRVGVRPAGVADRTSATSRAARPWRCASATRRTRSRS